MFESKPIVLVILSIYVALLFNLNVSTADGSFQLRNKRNVALRRITIKNEMDTTFSPVSVFCRGKDHNYMEAGAKLETGDQFSFTIYDIGNRVFYCEVKFKGTLPPQTFDCYNNEKSLFGGKLLLRSSGVYYKRPRRNPIEVYKWEQ